MPWDVGRFEVDELDAMLVRARALRDARLDRAVEATAEAGIAAFGGAAE